MSLTPDNQRLLTEFTPTRRVIVEWIGLGTGMVLVATFVFAAIYAFGTGQTGVGFRVGDVESAVIGLVLFLLLIVVVIVLHEAIHAAVIRHYGGDVLFGVRLAQFVLPYAYVTTTQRLERNQFIAVALAPLVVITLVGVPLMIALDASVLVIPLALNAGGAIGDLWMAGILLRSPSHVAVEDSVTGLKIYGRVDDVPLSTTTAQGALKRISLGTGVGFGLLLLVALAAPILLGILGIQSFTLGVPDSPWNVYSFESVPPAGFQTSVNPIGMLAVSVLLGFIYAFSTIPRTPTT